MNSKDQKKMENTFVFLASEAFEDGQTELAVKWVEISRDLPMVVKRLKDHLKKASYHIQKPVKYNKTKEITYWIMFSSKEQASITILREGEAFIKYHKGRK